MIVTLADKSPGVPEVMGLFGLSWPEKVASFMAKQLKGKPQSKKLKDFFQAGGKNVSLVNNLHREYMALMAENREPSSFTVSPDSQGSGGEFSSSTITLASLIENRTNVDPVIVLEFLRALYVLSRDGKIPFAKWNPKGYQTSTELKRTFKTEKGILDFTSKSGTYAKVLIVLASVGVGAYLLSQLKEFK